MTEQEKKAIESIKIKSEYIGDNYSFGQQGIRNLREELKIVLNLIQKQEEEINKLNNTIDRMAKRMENLQYEPIGDCFIPKEYSNINDCVKKESCKECIKGYFMEER